MKTAVCILCAHAKAVHFITLGNKAATNVEQKPRDYYHCPNCDLRFLAPSQRLSTSNEKARYLHHENNVQDPGYRKFVEPLVQAISKKHLPPAEGLDFGCGTGPILYTLFQELGYSMQKYDVFFEPNLQALQKKYDFVCASEVVEHFYDPSKEFSTLYALLSQGGTLGLMTHLFSEQTRFENWYYVKDPTHVCLYSKRCFEWIAEHFSFKITDFIGDRVVLLRKNA